MVDGTVDLFSDKNGEIFTLTKGAYIVKSRYDRSAWVTFSLNSQHSDDDVFYVQKDTSFEVLSVVNRISGFGDKYKDCYVVSEDLHYKLFLRCDRIKALDNRSRETNKALVFLGQGRRLYLKYETRDNVEVSSYSKLYKKLEDNYFYNPFRVGLVDE